MIYFDNAATTLKKPETVLSAVNDCIMNYCANPGRGAHKLSIKISEKIFETRERVAAHLGCDKPENVIFFQNATHALNFAIKTSIKNGDHIVISDIEHNSTARPIYTLNSKGIITYQTFKSSGNIRENLNGVIKNNTSCIVSTIHSNAFGREISAKELIAVSNERKIPLIIDASQYLGHKGLDVSCADNVMVCAPAHKALFGIQGCGFCYFSSPKKRDTITEGGSGNDSKNLLMPDDPPERYEAGTLSSPAIVSLLSGIDFIEETTLEAINERLDELTLYARECLSSIKKAMLYESGGGIVPFNIIGIPAEIVSYELSKVGICTRAGLQCAPLAHKVMDTYNTGTVRLSFSYFNKKSEISKLYKSLCDIVKLY